MVSEPGLIVYRFAVGLFFANATGFADQVRALTDGSSPPRWFALLADAMDDVDYSGGRTMVDVARRLRDRGITFAVVGASDKVRHELDLFGLGEVIGEDRYFAGLAPMREAFAAGGEPGGELAGPGGDPDGPAGTA